MQQRVEQPDHALRLASASDERVRRDLLLGDFWVLYALRCRRLHSVDRV